MSEFNFGGNAIREIVAVANSTLLQGHSLRFLSQLTSYVTHLNKFVVVACWCYIQMCLTPTRIRYHSKCSLKLLNTKTSETVFV